MFLSLYRSDYFTYGLGELLEDPSQYRQLIGRLLYLNFTRPDIIFSVNQLSQFSTKPWKTHRTMALQVLRYHKHTLTTGLFFSDHNSFNLKAFCDADGPLEEILDAQ